MTGGGKRSGGFVRNRLRQRVALRERTDRCAHNFGYLASGGAWACRRGRQAIFPLAQGRPLTQTVADIKNSDGLKLELRRQLERTRAAGIIVRAKLLPAIPHWTSRRIGVRLAESWIRLQRLAAGANLVPILASLPAGAAKFGMIEKVVSFGSER